MLAWMLYAICVSALLGISALFVERACRLVRRPTRWIWLAALVASVVIPALISFVAIEVPTQASLGPQTTLIRLREATVPSLSPERWVADIPIAQSPDLDSILERAWLFCSIAVCLVCILISAYWMRRVRRAKSRRILDEPVLIDAEMGPAVVGFIRPRIVLPQWMIDAPPTTLEAVLAHEREHVRARDPQLLLASLVFICVMPWNLPLWWIVVHLRRAIEVDCDARVLKDGRDPVTYGSLLLDVHQQHSAASLTAVALTERASFLETRIRLMLATPGAAWRWSIAGFMSACVASVAFASLIGPPDLRGTRIVQVSDSVFDRVTGYYHFGGLMVMRVERGESGRVAKLTGQRPWSLEARSSLSYLSRRPATEYEFKLGDLGGVVSLVMRQSGNTFTGRRVSKSMGQDLEHAFAARIAEQRPAPETQETIYRVLLEIQQGRPDYSKMAPSVAHYVRSDLKARQAELVAFGSLRSLTFEGVTPAGSDVYKADFDHGAYRMTAYVSSEDRLTRFGFDEWQSQSRKDLDAERFQEQAPLPGSAAALGNLIEAVRAGEIDRANLTPGLANVVTDQLASLQLGLASFGDVRSITFDRVAPNGWDVFSVRFDHAVIECSIELREDGRVASLLWDM